MGDDLARFLTGRPTTRLVEALTREYPIKQRTPDIELHMTDPDLGDFLVVVEVQARYDPTLARRLASLTAFLHSEHGKPVIPVVLYLRQPASRGGDAVLYEMAGSRFEVRPIEIVLPDMDAGDILARGLEGPWWPFVPFMRHGREPEIVDRLVSEVRARPELVGIADDMLRMVSHVVELDQLRRLLGGTMLDKIWEMEPFEGSYIWVTREKWLGKGREEGREEGRRQEILRVVKRAIARKFGLPEPDMVSRIELLSIEQLEDLVEALFDMTEPVDLTNHLGALSHPDRDEIGP